MRTLRHMHTNRNEQNKPSRDDITKKDLGTVLLHGIKAAPSVEQTF